MPDFYKMVLDSMTDGVYFVDLDRRITYWNRGAEQITGYSAEQATGHRCSDNLLVHVDEDGRQLCLCGCPLQATLLDGQDRRSEVFVRHRDGHRVPVLVRAGPIRDSAGEIVGAVEVFSDNSAAVADRERAESMQRLALLDALTEIGNRRYVEVRVRAKLEQARRYGWPLALALVDVDHFKQVNDVHGHDVGDRVLRTVAKTLEGSARTFDVVGRWGGEEFVVAMTNVTEGDALRITERLRVLVASSGVRLDRGDVRVTVSVGLTCVREGDTFEDLLRRADQLMYESKCGGRNRVTNDLREPAARLEAAG